MPDVAAAGYMAVLLVVVGNLNPVHDPFCCRDLVRPHDQQHVLGSEDAVLGQDIQDGMPGKEGSGKVNQIRDDTVVGIGPEGSELKAVAGLAFLLIRGTGILDGVLPGTVGVVLGIGAVADDEDLYVFIQATSCPEGISLITVDLIEGFSDVYTTAFQLDMDHGEAIDQDCHIITVIMPGTVFLGDRILIDDLQKVVVDVLLVHQHDVLAHAVITL